MKKLIVLLLIAGSAVAAEWKAPTTWTLPGGYLKKFPLHEVTDAELVTEMGAPEQTMVMGEAVFWTYVYRDGSEVRWTFILHDGIVVDVQYRAQRGRSDSARKRQGLDAW